MQLRHRRPPAQVPGTPTASRMKRRQKEKKRHRTPDQKVISSLQRMTSGPFWCIFRQVGGVWGAAGGAWSSPVRLCSLPTWAVSIGVGVRSPLQPAVWILRGLHSTGLAVFGKREQIGPADRLTVLVSPTFL